MDKGNPAARVTESVRTFEGSGMDERVKRLWVKALRSGKYEQATRRLRNRSGGFCCLGVLCDIYTAETGAGSWAGLSYVAPEGYEVDSEPPRIVTGWAGISDLDMGELAQLNDSGADFDQIAACIENGL